MTPAPIVFLVDVDNTPRDSKAVASYLPSLRSPEVTR